MIYHDKTVCKKSDFFTKKMSWAVPYTSKCLLVERKFKASRGL